MNLPVVTLHYLAALGLVFAVLSLVVVVLRVRHRVPFGDGDRDGLRRAVRAHGNFAEWVPLTVLLVGALEATGTSAGLVHGLMGALLAARIVHPVALALPLGSTLYRAGRIFGALTTWLVLVGSAALLLARL